MSLGKRAAGERPTVPAPVPTWPATQGNWSHEAPTRPNTALPTSADKADVQDAAPPSVDAAGPAAEPTNSGSAPPSVVDRLSDPGRWFDATPPPVVSLPPPSKSEQDPEQIRRRQAGQALVTLSMGISALILLAATVVRIHAALSAEHPRTVAAAAASSPTEVAAVMPTTASAVTEDPTSPDPPPSTGELQLGASAAGRRIVVDGHLVKDPSSSLRLSCGPHTVRIGYGGKARVAVVPCGGSVTVGM